MIGTETVKALGKPEVLLFYAVISCLLLEFFFIFPPQEQLSSLPFPRYYLSVSTSPPVPSISLSPFQSVSLTGKFPCKSSVGLVYLKGPPLMSSVLLEGEGVGDDSVGGGEVDPLRAPDPQRFGWVVGWWVCS